jgi:hypothetical protein
MGHKPADTKDPGAGWVLLVLTFRAATGQHLNGRRRCDDVTFWRDGTEADPSHWSRNPWWPRRAGWKRATVFWVPLAVAWGWWKERVATEAVFAAAGAVAVWLAVRAVRNWRHNHDWVYPQVEITLVKPPPGFVGFPAIRPYADGAEEHEIVFGLGAPTREFPDGAPVIVSVKNESPHIGLSMSSGDGKSIAVRNAACQLAHHGAIIAVLDPKLISQHWCAGLRNVAYARTAAEMHKLAIWLAGEVERRNDVVMYSADVEGDVLGKVGPRIAGLLEELNVAQMKLAAYWKEELGGKGKSPAVLALDLVSASGRQVDVNLAYVGQRLSAKATSGGSGDSRENLGVLLMSNPAASTWRMLVGDRHALPPATDVQGRLQVVAAKTVTEVQGAYVTGAQARQYATSGVVAVPRSDMPCVGGLAPVGTPERAAQDVPDIPAINGHGPDLHIVRDSPGLPPLNPPRITIREALEEGISGPSYDAVRKALARDRVDGKPVPAVVGTRGNADEYERVEWCDWEETRRQPRRLLR